MLNGTSHQPTKQDQGVRAALVQVPGMHPSTCAEAGLQHDAAAWQGGGEFPAGRNMMSPVMQPTTTDHNCQLVQVKLHALQLHARWK
jgi:hypothetical protein